VGHDGGYGSVLAERPIRRLLLASLVGRIAFTMLPLGFVFLGEPPATAGALVAAFAVTSALAPARGRAVDRHGPRALIAFALACAGAIAALLAANALDVPRAVLVALAALAGLFAPPLGPFTRSAWGTALRAREAPRQRVYALDSAAEEGALIVAPLIVALAVALGSPAAALAIAAAGLAAGTLAAARSSLVSGSAGVAQPVRGARLPRALWLLFAAFVPTAAALGAIDIGVPTVARAPGHPAQGGVILAAMAVGTVAGSLLIGRRTWSGSPVPRILALQAVFAAGFAASAVASGHLELLMALLTIPGAALGGLFATLYVLVDRLAPQGSGTRTFGWLVTANNGGLALGAALAGALSARWGAAAGLWLAAGCAVAGIGPAILAARMSARERRTLPLRDPR
jgi:hypothetical protein